MEKKWNDVLEEELEQMAVVLDGKLSAMAAQLNAIFEKNVTTPEERGGIQEAIDYIGELGGGTVLLAQGDYLTGTIVLRSNVCLKISEKARLLGSTSLADFPEHVAKRRTVMDTNMGMNQSLIFAEGCENICICGGGTIDAQGSRENFPGEETICGTPGRPFMMRIIDCENVYVHDVRLTNPACWTQNYLNCDNVFLESLDIESQSNYNNDGIDIDGCRSVIIRDCNVSSGDDSLCFKGAGQAECRDVLIEGCTLLSSCNAFKIGTDTQGDFRNILVRNCTLGGVSEEMKHIKNVCSDSGVSLEMVDGGTVERIVIKDVEIIRAMSPFFMRLEDRGRVKPEDEKPGIGNLRDIYIKNVTGKDNGPRGSYLLCIPEKHMENIVFENVNLLQKCSVKDVVEEKDFGELRGVYPDAHMIDDIGDAPAYALWAVNVDGLVLDDYNIIPEGDEARGYRYIINGRKIK